MSLKISVSNDGDVDGAEVPQVYLSAPEECDLPIWALKGFEKVAVKAGESVDVTFELEDLDFSYWSVEGEADAHGWALCEGEWRARVAFSANVDGEGAVEVNATIAA